MNDLMEMEREILRAALEAVKEWGDDTVEWLKDAISKPEPHGESGGLPHKDTGVLENSITKQVDVTSDEIHLAVYSTDDLGKQYGLEYGRANRPFIGPTRIHMLQSFNELQSIMDKKMEQL